MRLLPNKKSADRAANELVEALDRYFERHDQESTPKMAIYAIVFAHTIRCFWLIVTTLALALVGSTITSGFSPLTVILGIVLAMLIYQTLKHSITWSNEFVFSSDEDTPEK